MRNRCVIHNAADKSWLEFIDPVEVVQAVEIDKVIPALEYIEKKVNGNNLYAAGFISYDASPAFDKAFKVIPSDGSFPFLWFGLYSEFTEITLPSAETGMNYCDNWHSTVTREEYNEAIRKVREHIREGDTYQVNYTVRQNSVFNGDPWNFFCELAQSQKADYQAYIETGDFVICSASPELFFYYDKGKIISKPMKGTAPRGLTLEDDNIEADDLYNSRKNRAENLMIVDMIRNDLGRVSETGSVKVPVLFDVEKYPTVWQMTSTVESFSNASLTDIFKGLFPCASITGAPKVKTVEIITELEKTPRKIYTGAIGFIKPGSEAQFNVAIRTVIIDEKTRVAEYGVGGGITWDSSDSDEYNECLIKTKFLTQRQPEFSLLESLLWTPEKGFFLLEYHLNRLSLSAQYFEYNLDMEKVRRELMKSVKSLKNSSYKIRLLISQSGNITIDKQKIDLSEPADNLKVILADAPVDKNDPFLYHKTTNRKVYDNFKNRFPGYDEVILWNADGEITECCSANIVVIKDKNLVTPKLSCGLLAGTFREYLLDNKEIIEDIITIDDLKKSEEIFIINSVRKWRKVNKNLLYMRTL